MASFLSADGKLIQPSQAELQAADKDSEIICFTDGTLENGTPYWAYVAVKPSRYQAFIATTRARETLILEEYGRILHSGNGASVPVAIREEMQRVYGFDEQYVEKLRKQAEDERINTIVAMLKKKQRA